MTGMSAKEQADAVIARIQQQRASLAFLQKRRNQFEADLMARRRRSSAEAQAKAKAQSDAAKMSFMMDVPSAPQTERRPSKSAATAADVDDDAKEATPSKPDDSATNEGGMSFFMVPQTQRRSSRSLFKSGASSKDSKDRRSPPELERSPSFDWTKSRGSRSTTTGTSSSGSRKKLPPKSKSLDDARKGAVGGELRRARRGAKRPQLKRNKTFGEADGNASYDWSSSRSLMSNASKDSEDNNKPRRASVAKPPTRLARSKSAGYKDKDEEQSVADLNASMSGPADFNWSMSGPADFDWNTSGTADFDWNTSGTADFDWNTGGTADFDWNKGGTADFSWVTNLTADFNWSVTKQLADVLANVKSTTEAGEEEDNMMNNLDKLLENMQLECEALAKEQQQAAAVAPTTTTETQRVSTAKSKRSDDIASTSTHSTRSSMSSSPDHQWWKKQPVCQPAA